VPTNRPIMTTELVPRERLASFHGRPLANPDEDIYDQGLGFDVETLLDRRRMLKLIGYSGLSAGLLAFVGCAPSSGTAASGSAGATASLAPSASASAAAPSASSSASAASCDPIPEETAGPFPGDGSNGPDVLAMSGIVRKDIRSSFAGASGTAQGVPLTIRLAIQDAANGCAPLGGAAVYVWHCDRDGNYSMYSQAAATQNYLRGVQAAGSDGVATFTSIFPACYSGRWPHVHFEVYRTLDAAKDNANRIATSQIALPEAACKAVYATAGYASSIATMSQVSLQSDMVFSDDGGAHELGTVTGSVSAGYTVELAVPVKTS
jgi:protocatechuate 3,4-dioxygenase beta subunit